MKPGITLHFLNATGALDPVLPAITASLRKAEAHLATLVPIPPLDVTLAVNPAGSIPGLGHGGYCPSAHLIALNFNPADPAFAANLDHPLQSTFAHELHHALRWAGPGYGRTLGEALVTEGLAIAFAQEAFAGPPAAWEVAPQQALADLAPRASAEWDSHAYDHGLWFFGARDEAWSGHGYALGAAIVRRWLAATPGAKASTAAAMPSDDFRQFLEA